MSKLKYYVYSILLISMSQSATSDVQVPTAVEQMKDLVKPLQETLAKTGQQLDELQKKVADTIQKKDLDKLQKKIIETNEMKLSEIKKETEVNSNNIKTINEKLENTKTTEDIDKKLKTFEDNVIAFRDETQKYTETQIQKKIDQYDKSLNNFKESITKKIDDDLKKVENLESQLNEINKQAEDEKANKIKNDAIIKKLNDTFEKTENDLQDIKDQINKNDEEIKKNKQEQDINNMQLIEIIKDINAANNAIENNTISDNISENNLIENNTLENNAINNNTLNNNTISDNPNKWTGAMKLHVFNSAKLGSNITPQDLFGELTSQEDILIFNIISTIAKDSNSVPSDIDKALSQIKNSALQYKKVSNQVNNEVINNNLGQNDNDKLLVESYETQNNDILKNPQIDDNNIIYKLDENQVTQQMNNTNNGKSYNTINKIEEQNNKESDKYNEIRDNKQSNSEDKKLSKYEINENSYNNDENNQYLQSKLSKDTLINNPEFKKILNQEIQKVIDEWECNCNSEYNNNIETDNIETNDINQSSKETDKEFERLMEEKK